MFDTVGRHLGQREPTYFRTKGGRMIHKPGCGHLIKAKKAVRWDWAKGRTTEWLEACLEWNGIGGIAFCKFCCPGRDGQEAAHLHPVESVGGRLAVERGPANVGSRVERDVPVDDGELVEPGHSGDAPLDGRQGEAGLHVPGPHLDVRPLHLEQVEPMGLAPAEEVPQVVDVPRPRRLPVPGQEASDGELNRIEQVDLNLGEFPIAHTTFSQPEGGAARPNSGIGFPTIVCNTEATNDRYLPPAGLETVAGPREQYKIPTIVLLLPVYTGLTRTIV